MTLITPDADAMEAYSKQERDNLRIEEEVAETYSPTLDSQLKAAQNALKLVKNRHAKAQAIASLGKGTIIGGGGYTITSPTISGADWAFGAASTHDNKGKCQESYDQGYEDGLKAGQSGVDDRIK